MSDVNAFLDDLNHRYATLHTAKEDSFWTAFMGLSEDADAAQADLDAKEIALQRFIQDPENLKRTRDVIAAAGDDVTDEQRTALTGWERMFASNAIETAEARALAEQIIEAEGAIARARGTMKLGYHDPESGFIAASSVKLGTMLRGESNEALRRAAWDGLRSIETHVLQHGFIDIVKQRNRLGRMLGGEDYYDWKVRRTEGMSKNEIFALLDELEELTRDAGERSIDALRDRVGADQVTPWSIQFLTQGDVTREQDPFFPFDRALSCWMQSFAALGIGFQDATLRLDLVDRKGKYENGFMHGPEVAWREKGTRHPARIQFTANAIPGMVGSGYRAFQTLFHEGGHAAHFANIDMPAPCFGQEFAPTSVAFAEVQSMFCDSFLNDAEWQQRYACDVDGNTMPWELIEKGIKSRQPFAAWGLRGMLAVCYAERAIYEIPDDELTPERILEVLRAEERRLLFLDEGGHRPVLSVPHLISGDASAYYHGYVLAQMGVSQTRQFFRNRDGYLLDNPKIGPDLRKAYWAPGNSRRASAMIESLTGEPLHPRALGTEANRTVEEAVADAKAAIERAKDVPPFSSPVDLGAGIEIVHGNETIASLQRDGFEGMNEQFAKWIESLAAAE